MIHAKLVRKQIEVGILPPGLDLQQISQALKETRKPNVVELFGFLSAKHIKHGQGGPIVTDLGLLSCRLVTQAFTQYLVDALQDSTTYPMDAFTHHGSGTGVTAEANTQTALITEVETRDDGTQVEGASANIFRSVGTQTYTATRTIAEHGLFSAATNGTMLDRSLLGATIPVENTDQIEWTYELTVNPET